MGGMGTSARRAAQRNLCFEHPAHPLPLQNGASGLHKLIPEHETMKTTSKAGSIGAYAPAYLRRLARTLASKATRREALRAKAFELIAADRIGGAR
jgi:hypothetical protein